MADVGFHASHEQIAPGELLAAVRDSEAAGFTRAMCSDHFTPWSERQGHSGFAWSWLGAALHATSLPFGVVTAPGPPLQHVPKSCARAARPTRRARRGAPVRARRSRRRGRRDRARTRRARAPAPCRRASRVRAVEGGLLLRNPAAIRKAAPKASASGASKRIVVWSARELRRFLEHVAGDRLFALWRLAATTGMRRGELLGLTWRTLDLDAGSLTVEQQLVPTRGGVTFGLPKTKRSRRTIALDEETVAALKAHREAQLLERAFLEAAYVDHDLVFAREDGEPIHPQRLTDAFRSHVRAAKLPALRLHGLRHTHATLALTSGIPLHVVAARIGDDPARHALDVRGPPAALGRRGGSAGRSPARVERPSCPNRSTRCCIAGRTSRPS